MGKGKSSDGPQSSFYRTQTPNVVKTPKSGARPQYGGNRPPAMRRAQVRGRG